MATFLEIIMCNKTGWIVRTLILPLTWMYSGSLYNAFGIYLSFALWDTLIFQGYNDNKEKVICILIAIGCISISVLFGAGVKYVITIIIVMIIVGYLEYLYYKWKKKRAR